MIAGRDTSTARFSSQPPQREGGCAGPRSVPKVSEFYGVVIRMFFNDHEPPHFHAQYGGSRASVTFHGELLRGTLPPRAVRLVREWAQLHRSDLAANWTRARNGRPVAPIAPLE